MANISEFSSALNGSARPNQFQVLITFPTALVDNAEGATRKATYLTATGSIPNSTIEDIQIMYRGRQYHEAGERTYQPWTCTMYNSSDFAVRKALEQWSHSMLSAESTAGINNPSIYKQNIEIRHLDRNGTILRTYRLVGAYPQEIGQIQLGYDQNNAIEQFDVTFMYDYFTIDDSAIGKVAETAEMLSNVLGIVKSAS